MDSQSIGSYQIVGELGRGGMGVVYQAFDPAIGRPVAIKVIRFSTDMTAEDRAQLRLRLSREAGAAGKLSHPNLVTIYQLGEEGQDVFIAMEFVKGSTLRQLMLQQGGIPPVRCLDILRQTASGLDYAHHAGIIHRDVKPDNILIREDGCVKVADFGIAKIIEATTHHVTMTGMSFGSPAYMSPEQVKSEQLNARTDQFSLAIVAFEMFAGRKPFVADSLAALMHQIMAGDPLSAEDVRTRHPQHMIPAFARALAKHPADRFPSCTEFVQALTQGVPTTTLPTPAENRPAAPEPRLSAPAPVVAKRSRVPLILAVAALAAILAGGGYYFKARGPSGSGSTGSTKPQSPLVKAIAEGRLDDARNLLSHGANINSANPDGTTALMQAAEGTPYLPNNMPAVQMLLEKNPNLEQEDANGRTALYRAVSEGKDEAVSALLAHKADPNHRAANGSTPLLASVMYGKAGALKTLLAAGANLETPDNQGMTPLMQAAAGTAYMPNNVPFVEILIEKGAKIESLDKQGKSALFHASEEGKNDALNLLLDHKADPNLQDNSGATPLLTAVTFGKIDVVKTLLKRGAHVETANSTGTNPLMQAAEANAYVPNNAPLVQLLLDAGARVDAQDAQGRTAVYRAAAEGRAEAVGLLLDHKADPNQRPNDGATPLIAALANGKFEAVKLLLDRGAEANLADPSGRTPLMVIADGGPYIQAPARFATLLLAKGAKKEAVDGQSRTALARATEAKNTPMIDLLKQ